MKKSAKGTSGRGRKVVPFPRRVVPKLIMPRIDDKEPTPIEDVYAGARSLVDWKR